MPAALAHIWFAYLRIRRRKGSAAMGASPIEWPDIDAFLKRSGVHLDHWEIEIVEELDDAYMAEQARLVKAATDKKPPRR